MDFDFNLILVPVTLILFLLWLLDKLVLKQRATKGKGNENFLIGWAYDFWPVLAVVLFLRSFLYEPFNIPSESMVPTLKIGDFILVNKFDYGVRLPLVHSKIIDTGSPKHGDVAVFRYPENPKLSYIKRVVGLPGDKIEFKQGKLWINGQAQPSELLGQQPVEIKINANELTTMTVDRYKNQLGDHQFISHQISAQQQNPNVQALIQHAKGLTMYQTWSITVPQGHYFMIGDNRDQSEDSRAWGFVPEENLIGRAFYVWMHKEPGFNLPSFSRNGKID